MLKLFARIVPGSYQGHVASLPHIGKRGGDPILRLNYEGLYRACVLFKLKLAIQDHKYLLRVVLNCLLITPILVHFVDRKFSNQLLLAAFGQL